MDASLPLGFVNKVGRVPAGNLANAALLGAKTVKGPLPCNAAGSPGTAKIAKTNVNNCGVEAAS